MSAPTWQSVPVDPTLRLDSLDVVWQVFEGHLSWGVARARLAGHVVEPALVLDEVARELQLLELLVDGRPSLIHDAPTLLDGRVALHVQLNVLADLLDGHSRHLQPFHEAHPLQVVLVKQPPAVAGTLLVGDEPVLLVEADFEDTGLTKTIGKDGNLPDNGILDVLGEKCSLKDVSVRKNEKNILTAYSGLRNEQEDSHYTYTPEDVKRVMAEAKNLADFVLIDVGVWGGAGDGRIWNTESDFSLAVCAPEKAEFKAEDRMIEDLSNGQSDFAGIVLNGF